MSRPYQLAPIPLPRSGSAASYDDCSAASSSASGSSNSLALSISRSSDSMSTSSDPDHTLVSPSKPFGSSWSGSPASTAAGTPPPARPSVLVKRDSLFAPSSSSAVEKKRPSALSKLRLGIPNPLGNYARDPEGATAVAPPTPVLNQQLALATSSSNGAPPVSPGPVATPNFGPAPVGPDGKRSSFAVPARFQPKKMLQGKGFSAMLAAAAAGRQQAEQQQQAEQAVENRPKAGSSGQGPSKPQKQRLSQQGFPFPDMHLTPPPTPLKNGQQTLPPTITEPVAIPNSRLPPTPSSSPTSLSAGIPRTVSAQALYDHPIHPRFMAEYELGDELGSGGFGFVVQALRRQDGRLCAVKFIYKDKVPERAWVKDEYWGDADDARGVQRTSDGTKRVPLEAYVLKTIRHRGVVAFVDLFEDSKYIYLIMEHHGSPWQAPPKAKSAPGTLPSGAPHSPNGMSSSPLSKNGGSKYGSFLTDSPLSSSPVSANGGYMQRPNSPLLDVPVAPPMMRRSSCDLFECIEQHSRLPEAHAKYVFAQLIDVVGCLHYNGFVHRDIKDENIVIDDTFRVKLIDFGSAHLFDYRRAPRQLTQFFGTLNFAAPEILRDSNYQPMAAEIWSLGILLSILVTGESFFRNPDSIRNYTPSAPVAGGLSNACLDIIWRCLAENPKDRWSCFRLRYHPWLADSQWAFSTLPDDAILDSVEHVRRAF